LEKEYLLKCKAIMNASIDISWGLGDWMINELFYDYLGGFIEE
jgi:hypothetical protein